MAKKKGEGDYELVSESKFNELEAKLHEISKSPFVSTPGVEKVSAELEGVHTSIESLLSVLTKLADATSFDEAEKDLLKKQIKPLTKEVEEVKEQNDSLKTTMDNIVERLNDIQSQVTLLTNKALPIPSPVPDPSLPPLSGGPSAPNLVSQAPAAPAAAPSAMPPIDPVAAMPQMPTGPGPMDALPAAPAPIGGKPVEGLPPLEKHKKGLFK